MMQFFVHSFEQWIFFSLLSYRQQGSTDNREETTSLKTETSSFSNLTRRMHQRKSDTRTICLFTSLTAFVTPPPLFCCLCLAWHPLPQSDSLFPGPVESGPPSEPKHRFSKLWQLCYLRSGSAPTPNCSSIWRSILLSRYFINLHHGCQHWHSWQRGQCHLLLSPFSR